MLRERLSIEPLANRVGTRGIGVHACPPLDLPRGIPSVFPRVAALRRCIPEKVDDSVDQSLQAALLNLLRPRAALI